MRDQRPALPQRRSRFWLLAPFVLLALLAAGWSAAWFFIRDEAARRPHAWVAREAAQGRQWLCANRSLAGFPFRIELGCDSLALQRPDMRLSLGPVRAVAQVYTPWHVIVQAVGPLRAEGGTIGVSGEWTSLEASIRADNGRFQRASVVLEGSSLRLTGLPAGDLTLASQRFETHLRPNPARANEGAYDWNATAAQARIPPLDEFVGSAEPSDLDLRLVATQVRDPLARPVPSEIERWREAGGRIEVPLLAVTKGARRIEAKGELGLDPEHRLQGRFDLAAAGLEELVNRILGNRLGITIGGNLLGALTGQPPASLRQAPSFGQAAPGPLRPLPPLRLEGGRVLLGPLAVPGIRLLPLY
jgi:hypothetical protein